ncbi:uncharacterized protein FOMMEDRAFT_170954 [Fomitiporia mediterranea MF3/22]|uniref:uncharacterized protein n=1 Tax=Fomitiporia mediterranea (strain MF3/22) TaxID=694068 RepID=UPI00044077B4|nr:uncharacterized protein FOMMEDRAFT_170954 [Fomitiporia mediterranea MF3/22]EJC98748.1 hypothetical protein FOMMEDRAFT_170954 [Fomitiporia mediterranea MF3/22]
MVSPTTDVPALINSLQGLRLASYVDTASFVILVYDYLLTFEDELVLIWDSTWSLAKGLFLATRYLPFIDLSITTTRHFKARMSPEECLRNYRAGGLLIDVGICAAELILVLRTWAIWGQTKKITITLLIWIFVNLTSDLVIVVLYFSSVTFTPLPEGLSGCLISTGNSLLVGTWILLMIFEAGILALMVLKGVQMYRGSVDKQHRKTELYKAVFRNGAIFYVYIFTLSVANVIVISRLPRDLSTLLASVERVMHAILTERLLLTLRRIGHEQEEKNDDSLNSIQFQKLKKRAVDSEAGTSTFLTTNPNAQWSGPEPSTSTSSTSTRAPANV